MVKKMKDIVKKNPVANATFGTDPSNPWATKYNVTEATETELLARYLNSRGVNPRFVTRDTKIAHAKSSEYAKWKADHIERFAREETQITENDTSEKNEMAQAQLHFIKYACEEILEYIDKGGEVEEWYQVKIAKSFSEFESLHSFMEGEARRLGLKEESEQIDELAPETLASYVLKTTSKDPKRAEPRKKAMGKLAKIMAKRSFSEAKTIQGTALDKFRQAAADRARKHDDIEREMKARHAAGKEDMKGSIDRLQAHLNKEEVELDEGISDFDRQEKSRLVKARIATAKLASKPHDDKLLARTGMNMAHKFPRKGQTNLGNIPGMNTPGVSKDTADYAERRRGDRAKELKPAIKAALGTHGPKGKLPEEVEQIDELKMSTSAAGINKAKETQFHKKLDTLVHNTFGKRKDELKMKEDAFQDTQAATQMPFDGANTTNDTDMMKRREATKSARIIKSIYKRKNMKEDMNDWEKEDKSVQTYGKKPKLGMTDKKDNVGENKPEARAVMAGGKTLTGQPRDMVEIDPTMKNRPDRPDTFDKGNPKKSPA
jgi:hypothetical protein